MYVKVRMYAYNWYISDGNNDACQRFVTKDQQKKSFFFLVLLIDKPVGRNSESNEMLNECNLM